MSIVKHLPAAAIPRGGVKAWRVKDAQRWLDGRVPAAFAPVTGGWVLAPLVLLAVVLIARNESEAAQHGTEWSGYAQAVLLLALPGWYRFLPAATLVSTPLIALDAVTGLYGIDPADGPGRVGRCLVLALCAWAFAGSLVRLASRRRQRALFLETFGRAGRYPVPEHLPDGHRRRGVRLLLAGGALCLAATALLVWGTVQDLGAGREHPYDATGQQVLAMLLLVPGTPLLGRGLTARRAARRLHDGPQPVMRIGVRRELGKCSWLFANATTTGAPPLIGFRDRFADGHRSSGHRATLLGGAESRLRADHHDIDQDAEPYEALMYGVPCEGAEVILRYAVYSGGSTIVDSVTAAPLLPLRRSRLRPWRPAGTSYTLEAERRRQERAARAAERSSGSGGSGCGSSGGCGSDSSCGSSCGGGCGGGD
ncbi:hypothetical protein ACWGE1_24050 [Streptomyces sp. NPDC054932]